MFSKIFFGLLFTCTIATAQNTTASLYDIPLTDISGATLDLSQYKGKNGCIEEMRSDSGKYLTVIGWRVGFGCGSCGVR